MIPAQRQITENHAALVHRYNHRRRTRTAPGPQGHHLLGSLLEVRRDMLQFVVNATKQYGGLVNFRMGARNIFLVSHNVYAQHILHDNQGNYRKGLGLLEAKSLLGDGLLTSEGNLWAVQRRFLQAAFHGKKLEEYSAVMVRQTESLLKRWSSLASAEQDVDVADEMAKLTLNILGATLFGQDFSAISGELARHLNTVTGWAIKRMTSLWKLPLSIPSPRNRRAGHALRRLDEMVEQMFAQHRRQEAAHKGHLLSLLLESAPGQMSAAGEKQARDEVMTFLLAGHETTAATLSWALFLLAQSPEVAERLQLELEEVLGGRTPGWADVPRLEYARMVLSEAMRLYPPVWLLPRKAIEEDRVGDYLIPPRSDVLISVYSLHRNPAYWQDPDKFIPERFAHSDASHRPACTYIPFGAGQRTCPGNRFGLMEATLALAMLAQRYRFESLPAQSVIPKATLSLRPQSGLKLKLIRRD
jgi:cytochrome P450